MNSRERFHAALDRETPDRIPLFYQHLGAAKWLLQSTGLRMFDGFHDPEVFAKLSMAAYDLYGFDNVMAGWGDILVEAQAHGMTWKFPERDFYPRVDRYVPMDAIDKIQPVDPLKDRFWSVPLKAAGTMMDRLGKDVAVVGCINSPTVIASELVGMENLLLAYLTEPEPVVRLLDTLTESSRRYGERLVELGVEDIFIENGTAGQEMVSQEMYEQYDRPYLQAEMDAFREQGLRTIVHNCAAQPFWRSQLETVPTGLHLHLKAVNVPEVFSEIKGRSCMLAGIDHMELLFTGTPDDVEKEVDHTIAQWGTDPGLIISPGCELLYKTPMENIKRLKESVVKHGTP
jgi:MtaA/CmuA family methyltransferase